jgi:hypothetical protein
MYMRCINGIEVWCRFTCRCVWRVQNHVREWLLTCWYRGECRLSTYGVAPMTAAFESGRPSPSLAGNAPKGTVTESHTQTNHRVPSKMCEVPSEQSAGPNDKGPRPVEGTGGARPDDTTGTMYRVFFRVLRFGF